MCLPLGFDHCLFEPRSTEVVLLMTIFREESGNQQVDLGLLRHCRPRLSIEETALPSSDLGDGWPVCKSYWNRILFFSRVFKFLHVHTDIIKKLHYIALYAGVMKRFEW